jgi:hypothetical protein
MKYVLVTGGVVSGLGKGVTASSIGVVLKACGLRVTSVKIGQFFQPPFLSFKWFLGLGSFLTACVFSLDLILPEGEREEGKSKSGCCNVGNWRRMQIRILTRMRAPCHRLNTGRFSFWTTAVRCGSHLLSNTLLDLP